MFQDEDEQQDFVFQVEQQDFVFQVEQQDEVLEVFYKENQKTKIGGSLENQT
jgi:hypothetical protein